MNSFKTLYTAAKLAFSIRGISRALGLSPQAIRRRLPVPSITDPERGVCLYRTCELPADYQLRLESRAEAQGFRNPEALLAHFERNPEPVCRAPQPCNKPAGSLQGNLWEALEAALDVHGNGPDLNLTRRQLWWEAAVHTVDAIITAGRKESRARAEVVDWLWARVPTLARSKEGLRLGVLRAWRSWLANGRQFTALADKRPAANATRRVVLPEEIKDRLIAKATFECGGRLTQAWREVQHTLPPELRAKSAASRRKSYVPQAVREAVAPEIRALADLHRGPRQHRLNGLCLRRDWSKVFARDWVQMDDKTPDIYGWTLDAQGAVHLLRGQFIPAIDLRTTRILGFLFHPQERYYIRTVRALLTRVFSEHGLPNCGLWLECGTWKSSHLLGGERDYDEFPWEETEAGLKALGLEIRHTLPGNPRAKPIERVIGAIDRYLEGVPGYVGRNEQVIKFERVQSALRDVRDRGADPREAGFLSVAELEEIFAKACERYNAEPHDRSAVMIPGLSPDQAFEQLADAGNPPSRFDASCSYLLAHHVRQMPVSKSGAITLAPSFGGGTYASAELGRLVKHDVLVWYHPEQLGFITVTDTHRKNPIIVPLFNSVPGDAAPDSPQLSEAMRTVGEFNGYARTRYRVLKAKFPVQFRPNIVDPRTAKLGRQIAAKQSAHREQVQRETRRQRTVQRQASELGLPREILGDDADESLAALRTALQQPE